MKKETTQKKITDTSTEIEPPTSSYRLSKEEHETHLYIDEIDNCWIADTSIQKDINKFKKQGWTIKKEFKYPDGSIKAMEFTAPRNAMPIGKANKTKRNITDEQRQASSDRMKILASNRKQS